MTRRRVGAGVAGLALVLGVGLSACAQDNTPDQYDTLTKQNFLEGCTNFYYENTDDNLTQTGNTVAEVDGERPDENQCVCMYDVFANQMPINSSAAEADGQPDAINFTDFNKDLQTDNPQDVWNTLPQEIKDSLADCEGASDSSGSSGSTTTTEASSDTTAAS